MKNFRILSLRLLMALMLIIVLVGCKNKDTDKEDPDDDPIVGEGEVTTTKLVTYDGPSIMTSSSLAQVAVNGHDLFVYETRVNNGRVFTYGAAKITKMPVVIFDFEGKVSVSVKIPNVAITSAKVTPQAYGIVPAFSNDTITFDLSYPGNYVVEYNNGALGEPVNAVHIFANPLEKNTPDPANLPANMIYIGPGVYKADAIPVKSNQTVYLAGGAVVYGQIRAEEVENVTICGRGILSGEIFPRTIQSEFTIPFEFRHAKNITVKDIAFLDSAGWTINAYFIDGFYMDNVRIMTARGNGDGISLQSCKNARIKNCFVRSWDDSLVVKNYDRGTTSNILFENITIWTDLAQSMEVGYECNGATIDNVVFNNITVLHNYHKAVMSIHNADDAAITNVKFTNITVEDAEMNGDNQGENYDDLLIDFKVLYNLEWTTSATRGTIDNVLVDNVKVLSGKSDLNTQINGFDANHRITNVQLNNITYLGNQVTKASDLRAVSNGFTSGITYDFSKTESSGARLMLPYNLKLADANVEHVAKPNIVQEGFLVPDFSIGELKNPYMGIVVTGTFNASSYHGISTLDWGEGKGSFENGSNVASNILDNDLSTNWQGKPFDKVANEFATLNITFDAPKMLGTIRIYGNPDSRIYLVQNISLYGIRSDSTKFSKITNAADYEFSPAKGNYVDIKINPGEFTAIQIRVYYKVGPAYPNLAFINEVKFYPASLSYNKVVTGTIHEDVYRIENLTDGFTNTYYEAKKGMMPAEVIVNFDGEYMIRYINLYLPPLMLWEARTEVISFFVSTDGVNYTEIIHEKSCLFDPVTGNVVEIVLETPVEAKYLKLNIVSNTASGGVSAQLSEISVFE